MNYNDFKNKYNGQYVDVDGYPKEWPYQCFDLAQLYFQEVLNVPDYVLAGCGYVKNMLVGEKRQLLNEYFYEVDHNHMEAGDVCIWDETIGKAGHIAMYDHYNENGVFFFSQNPNPSQVMQITMNGMHCFHRKSETPPLPPVTDTVAKDEYKDQIEVKVSQLRVRTQPTLNGEILGFAVEGGIYNYYEKANNDGYDWYRIADNQWIAYNDEWETVYPAKPKKEYIELEILEKKDDYVLVDLGKVWIKKD